MESGGYAMKIWMSVFALLLTFSATQSAFAQDPLTGLHKRFKIDKSGDNVVIKMKLFNSQFKIAPYLKQIKNDLKDQIERMTQKDGQQEIDDLIAWLDDGDFKNDAESIYTIRRSLENLPHMNWDALFNGADGQGVFKQFEKDLQDVMNNFSLTIVANSSDARFFYRRNVTYEVVTKALEFAKKRFDSIPVLNLASYIIVKVHDLIIEQRTFHQNMLLHYLENFPEEKLGLTKAQVDKIFSSIYESRISALNYWESNSAVQNWASYGLDKFYAMVRMANNKIRRGANHYDSVNNRYNFAFVEVVENGERVVKNLIHNQHSFSSKSATAYNYDKPLQVKRNRALLNLAQVGLGLIPIPGWIKSQVDGFINSLYREQQRLEGALIAYFDTQNNQVMKDKIFQQILNPFIVR